MKPPPTDPLYVVAIRPVLLALFEQSQLEDLGFGLQRGGVVPVLADALNWKGSWPYSNGVLREVEPYMDWATCVLVWTLCFVLDLADMILFSVVVREGQRQRCAPRWG